MRVPHLKGFLKTIVLTSGIKEGEVNNTKNGFAMYGSTAHYRNKFEQIL